MEGNLKFENIFNLILKCKQNFQQLSDDQKLKKVPKKKENSNYEPSKYNNYGVPVEQIMQTEREAALNVQRAENAVSEILIDAVNIHGLESKVFYFISVNYFLKREATYVWPCELAISEFSIKDGITRTMHTVSFNLFYSNHLLIRTHFQMINPGPLPLGFASDARLHSLKNHRIELPDEHSEGETDYTKIFKKILAFVGANEFVKSKIPPLYSGLSDEDFDGILLTLDIMAQESGYDYNAFSVYPIQTLFFKLQHQCVEIQNNLRIEENLPFSSQIFAKNCLEADDDFQFCPIGCDFHNEIDAANACCLSKVKRWGYCIAKYCIDNRIEFIPGRHCPQNFCKAEQIIKLEDSEPSLAPSFKRRPVELMRSTSSLKTTSSVSGNILTAKASSSSNPWLATFLEECDQSLSASALNGTDSDSTFTGRP